MVELLVVLVVAALLLSAVPSLFSAAVPGMEMKSAARQVVSTLRLARESAIRRGTDIAVVVDVGAHRLELAGYRSLSIPERIRIELDAANEEMLDDQRGAIRFFPDGSSTGGRLVLEMKGHGYQVGVSWLTGRIELADWAGP